MKILPPAIAESQPRIREEGFGCVTEEDFAPFVVECPDLDCRSRLLIDDPSDLVYVDEGRWDRETDSGYTAFVVVIVCPNCETRVFSEDQYYLGNPASFETDTHDT